MTFSMHRRPGGPLVLARVRIAGHRHYCHDALDRLTSTRSAAGCSSGLLEAYEYDAAGNRTRATLASPQYFRYSGAGQLCEQSASAGSCPADPATWAIRYDDAGRTSAWNGWTLTYDGEGRLASACRVAGCASGDMVRMRYDGDGRRVELVAGPNGGAATTRTFRYQGSAIAQELTNGVVTRSYVTDEAGTIVKVCDPACTGSNPQYLVTWNGHGDALALWRITSDGSLTLANSYTYSTWGAPTTATHNAYPDLGFRYLYVGASGVAWDNALGLGLLHMGARHYSPTLGRFLQPTHPRSRRTSTGTPRTARWRRWTPMGPGASSASAAGPAAVAGSAGPAVPRVAAESRRAQAGDPGAAGRVQPLRNRTATHTLATGLLPSTRHTTVRPGNSESGASRLTRLGDTRAGRTLTSSGCAAERGRTWRALNDDL